MLTNQFAAFLGETVVQVIVCGRGGCRCRFARHLAAFGKLYTRTPRFSVAFTPDRWWQGLPVVLAAQVGVGLQVMPPSYRSETMPSMPKANDICRTDGLVLGNARRQIHTTCQAVVEISLGISPCRWCVEIAIVAVQSEPRTGGCAALPRGLRASPCRC